MRSKLTESTVNILEFRKLYFKLLLPKFCFLCTCFLKHLDEWQTDRSSLICVYHLCICHFVRNFVVRNFRTFTAANLAQNN